MERILEKFAFSQMTEELPSAKAITNCDLCSLSRKDFEELLDEFPKVKSVFEHIAINRLSKCPEDGNFRKREKELRDEYLKSGRIYTSVAPPPSIK